MNIQEFKARAKRTCTDKEYKAIEFVYMYHPCISETSGKDQIATLWDIGGARLIEDMTDTARKAADIEKEISAAKAKVQALTEEYRKLKEFNFADCVMQNAEH